MRVFSHYSVRTLSNTYLVGFPSGEAILIDPSVFDGELLNLIEGHRYELCSVLLTHNEEKHLAGLRTLPRVYGKVQIFSALPRVMNLATRLVTDGETLKLCDHEISVIALPGHGRDRVAYLLGGFLFCGPAFSAGEPGDVSNPYAKAILLSNISEAVFSLPDETVILPFYGPPTTVAVERNSFPMEDPLRLAGLV